MSTNDQMIQSNVVPPIARKKVSSTEVEMHEIFLRMWMHVLITNIDHGNSKLVCSELELFLTLESSRNHEYSRK